MQRSRNTATARDVVKVFKGNGLKSFPEAETYATPDCSEVCENFQELLVDLLRVTTRPAVPVLQQACVDLFPGVTKDSCGLFCRRLCHAISFCRGKRSATSGKKLEPAVYRVLQALRREEASTSPAKMSPSPVASAERKREASPATSPRSKVRKLYSLDQGASPAVPAVDHPESGSDEAEEVLTVSSGGSGEEEAPPAGEAPPGQSPPEPREYFDASKKAMVRTYSCGKVVVAEMRSSSSGFMKAVWPCGAVTETLVPVLVFKKPAMRRPAAAPAASASKAPKDVAEDVEAASSAEDAETPEAPAVPAPARILNVEHVLKYTCMYYKASGKAALRQCFGNKKQLFQFGSKAFSKSQLQEVGRACCAQLTEGKILEEQAKAWCEEKLS